MAKRRKKSITQQIFDEAKVICNKQRYPNSVTYNSHLKNIYFFIRYARDSFNAHTLAECLPHVQDYADFLVSKGYSSSTIHTKLSAVCAPLNNPISLKSIHKPLRKLSETKRGRDLSKKTITSLSDPANIRLTEFAKRCGIRKSEYRRLENDDFIYDMEFQAYFVRVKKGKGGRYQLQRILDEDVDFVKKYFNPNDPHGKVFKPSEFKKLNLHRLRALHAQEVYEKLEAKLLEDESFAKVLERDLEIYWNRFKGTPFPRKKITEGYYYLRGDLRKDAIARGKNTSYRRLTSNYVSFFCLAHARIGVAIQSYLLV